MDRDKFFTMLDRTTEVGDSISLSHSGQSECNKLRTLVKRYNRENPGHQFDLRVNMRVVRITLVQDRGTYIQGFGVGYDVLGQEIS